MVKIIIQKVDNSNQDDSEGVVQKWMLLQMQLLDGYVSTKLNDSKHTYKSEYFVQSKSE